MSKVIHKINDATLTIDGNKYAVSGFTLVTALTTIPSIELMISHKLDSSDKDTTIVKFELDKVIKASDIGTPYVSKGSFSIKITSESGDSQELDLKDWIFVGAGVSICEVGQSPTAAVTLMHPAAALNMYGGFLVPKASTLEDKLNFKIDQITDVVSAWDIFLTVLGGSNIIEDATGTPVQAYSSDGLSWSDMQSAINETIKKFISEVKFTSLLEWNPGAVNSSASGLPLQNVISDANLIKGIKKSILDGAMSISSASIWDTFVSNSCVPYGIVVLPDYWAEKLPVAPYTAWGKPYLTLTTDNPGITKFAYSGVDVSPIYGVRESQVGATASISAYTARAQSKAAGAEFQLAYVPIGAKVEPAGKLVSFASAPWWSNAILFASSDVGLSAYKTKEPDANAVQHVLDQNGTAMLRMAEGQFLAAHRKSCDATVVMPLVFKVNGEYLKVGRVITVKDGESTLVRGIIRSVTYSADIRSGLAYTGVQLGHGSSDPDPIVPEPRDHPLFT